MIILTDEEFEALKEDCIKEAKEALTVQRLNSVEQNTRQIAENTVAQGKTKAEILEQLWQIRDPHERQKIITENKELFGL